MIFRRAKYPPFFPHLWLGLIRGAHYSPPSQNALPSRRTQRTWETLIASLFLTVTVFSATAQIATAQEVAEVAVEEKTHLRIAGVAIRSKEKTLLRWQATAEHLSKTIDGYTFEIVPLNWSEMHEHAKAKNVDFVLTNPAMYVEFEFLYSMQPIALLGSRHKGKPITKFGSIIFRRADRTDINSIEDLVGMRFGAVNRSAWGGLYLAMNTMLDHDIHTLEDTTVTFTQSHDKVVFAVLNNKVDAGTVRTGILERMAESGQIDISDFEIINPMHYGNFPYLVSTNIYPEWPFAAMPHINQDLRRTVLKNLLDITPESHAAKTGRYSEWTAPSNYHEVHTVLKRLRQKPYENYGDIKISQVLIQHWDAVSLLVLFLLGMITAVIRFNRLNGQLNESADSLRQAEKDLQVKNQSLESAMSDLKRTQDQIVAREKLASLGELTAGVAHEIKNPLNFIKNFSEINEELVDEINEVIEDAKEELTKDDMEDIKEVTGDIASNCQKIAQHSKRADSIVRNMLAHSRGDAQNFQETDLNDLVEESVNLSYHGMRSTEPDFNVKITTDYDDRMGTIYVIPQPLGRVVLNIVNNACQATHQRHQEENDPGYEPEVKIETKKTPDGAQILIGDNGCGIKPESLKKIFSPFFTTKPTDKGTGLGLSICSDIIRGMHKGEIGVKSTVNEGTEFKIIIPTNLDSQNKKETTEAVT